MSLSEGAGRPTMADNINRGIFVWLGTDPIVRLWTGGRRMRLEANDLDAEPQIYDGLGELRDIPEIDRLINRAARRVTFTLSGLSENIVALVDADMVGLDGCRARIGHMRYDRHWQATGQVRWVFDGLLDDIGLEQRQQDRGHEWSVIVSMSSALVDRNRPRLQYWTPTEHKVDHPTDLGLDLVPGYNAGTTRLYPPR